MKTDLEAAGFKNITIKLHPGFERVGLKQDPLFQQIWPRLRASITFDVPSFAEATEDRPSATTPQDRPKESP